MGNTVTQSRRVSRRGFTLMELLLVLAVLLLLAGIAAPALITAYDKHLFRQDVEEVRTRLARTRLHAVDTGVLYQFRFEPGGRRYLVVPLEIDSDAAPNATGTSNTSSLSTRYPMHAGLLREAMSFELIEDTDTAPPAMPDIPPVPEALLQGFPDATELAGVSWSPPIVFRPDGEAEEAAFFIVDDDKRSVRFHVRSLTGAVSVGDIQQEKQ